MPEREPSLGYLKEKYNLHNAPEVKKAAKHAGSQEGKEVPKDPANQKS